MNQVLKIGTRGSPLALAQAHEVRSRLIEANTDENLEVEIEVISTSGDQIQDRPLSEIGGKGLFTLEIEQKLTSGEIDMAVHSTKDMPTELPDGLELCCYLPREAPEDAFISHKATALDDLPNRAVIGSSSLRRQAMIKQLRPDIEVVTFRGNLQTRLRKLKEGQVDATLLAVAGLNRLGMQDIIASVIPRESFLPAPGQGAICVEVRSDNASVKTLLSDIHDETTGLQMLAERAFLSALDGSCRTPLAAHAEVNGDTVLLHGMILSPDGSQSFGNSMSGLVQNASEIGRELAQQLRRKAGPRFFEGWN